MVKNTAENGIKSTQKQRPFKGIILDGRVYRAVVAKEFFRLCDGCDVGKDGLCKDGELSAYLCNAFHYAHPGVPVRFRLSPTLTETLKNMQKL